MKTLRRILIVIVLTLLLAGVVAGVFVRTAWRYQNPQTLVVSAPRGTAVRTLSAQLQEHLVIKNSWILEVYLRATGQAAKIKAGDYEFEAGTTMPEVVAKLISGQTKQYQFTIPEGYTVKDLCRIFSEKSIMATDLCLELSFEVSLLKNDEQAQSLEGYLFPETYTYDSQSTPRDIFKNMVTMFYDKVGEERLTAGRALGFSPHDLVTLASVVEKETGLAAERPLIAGVFLNRLKIGMMLQSDPTTIYGIPNFSGNLTRADLEKDSPYNTYTRAGLPIGPICNPGLAAIDAVLHPTATPALYFVAKGDGSHYFSATLAEHNDAVNRYQRHGASK